MRSALVKGTNGDPDWEPPSSIVTSAESLSVGDDIVRRLDATVTTRNCPR